MVKSSFTKGFFLILLTTIFTATGQIFFNYASETFELTFSGIFLNYFVWIGFATYGLGLLVLIFGLRDGELTSLYPILSLSFIWVLIAASILFNEPITWLKSIGTIVIAIGVAIIGISETNKTSKKQKAQKKVKSLG